MKTATALCLAIFLLGQAAVAQTVIYNSLPDPAPYNLPSLGYEAESLSEVGNEIVFAGTERQLTTVTIGMSTWSKASDYIDSNGNKLVPSSPVVMDLGGYYHTVTLNIYNAGQNGAVGSLITSKSIDAYIPWFPNNNPSYHGMLFNLSYDFTADDVVLPDDVIFTVAFDTQNHGFDPTGVSAPYNSLNYALSTGTTIGTDVDADGIYLNGTNASMYNDNGAGGTGTLRSDPAGWQGYTPAIQVQAVQAVPEPAVVWSFLFACAVLLGIRARRRMVSALHS